MTTDTEHNGTGVGPKRAAGMIRAARALLVFERLWPLLWPGIGFLGLFGVLALSGAYSLLPGFLQLLVLIALFGAAAFTLWRELSTFEMPDWHAAARRLEQDSGLAHRPITEGDDTLAVGRGDALSEELWRRHLIRLLAAVARLHLKRPKSALPQRDPYGLRFALVAALAITTALARADGARRLTEALSPRLGTGGPPAVLTAWVTPPAYTGLPPRTLDPKKSAEVGVPKGSTLVMRLRASASRPHMRIVPAPAHTDIGFKRVGSDYEAKLPLAANAHVTVRLGSHVYGDWRIALAHDLPPTVNFTEMPSVTQQQALKFSYRAKDDYGVEKLQAEIVPDDTDADDAKALIVPLPVPPKGNDAPQTAYRDLTADAYAGLKVRMTLVAIDAVGQTGRSRTITMMLPERVFTRPLARALVEQRRVLALKQMQGVAPVRDVIDALTVGPQLFYHDKYSLYLAMRTLYWQLVNLNTADAIPPTLDFMWDIALNLEEGDLALAANDLHDAQQALMDALERGASDDEISALMQKLRQAIRHYMEKLAQNGDNGGPMPPNARTIRPEDLSDILKAIQDLSRTGARDQARQLLSQLSDLLQNLRAARPNGQTDAQKAADDALHNLSDLMAQQRDLMDKTFRAQQGQQQGSNPGRTNRGQARQSQDQAAMAQQQRQMKDKLDSIMGGLVKNAIAAPRGLGSAGEAMNQSAKSLDSGAYDSASKQQADALESLREGAAALAQSQLSGSGTTGTSDSDMDPLGREAGTTGFGGSVKIPDKSQLARAREILDELRKRAGERTRPQAELDYIERLLKRF